MNSCQTPELQGHCPVAYFAVGQAVPGKPEHASMHEGKLYYLVNAEAKQAFDEDPEKYVPAYDGLCAFGLSIEKEFEPDPTSFKIINGRLHLFLKNGETDALELWNREDEAKCLASADRYWASRKSA